MPLLRRQLGQQGRELGRFLRRLGDDGMLRPQPRERTATPLELAEVVAHPIHGDVADPADRVLEPRHSVPAHVRAHECVLHAIRRDLAIAGRNRE